MIGEPFSSLLSIILMVILGYYLCAKKWFTKESTNLITRLILDIAIPFSIIANLVENVSLDLLKSLSLSILVPFISIGCEYIISFLIAKVGKIDINREGLFISMFSNPNTLFIGIPVNIAVFGVESLPYAYIYYIISTLFFNTIGILFLSKNTDKPLGKDMLKENLITPILISFFITLAIILFKICLPDFFLKASSTVGGLATPLSLMFIGISLKNMNLKKIKVNAEILMVILGRFVISPLITLFIARLLRTPDLALQVFVLQSLLPCMTSTPIFSERYGCDTEYATIGTTITALLSLLVIPLYTYLFF